MNHIGQEPPNIAAGIQRFLQNDFEGAIRAFTEEIGRLKEPMTALGWRALMHIYQRNFSEAAKDSEQAYAYVEKRFGSLNPNYRETRFDYHSEMESCAIFCIYIVSHWCEHMLHRDFNSWKVGSMLHSTLLTWARDCRDTYEFWNAWIPGFGPRGTKIKIPPPIIISPFERTMAEIFRWLSHYEYPGGWDSDSQLKIPPDLLKPMKPLSNVELHVVRLFAGWALSGIAILQGNDAYLRMLRATASLDLAAKESDLAVKVLPPDDNLLSFHAKACWESHNWEAALRDLNVLENHHVDVTDVQWRIEFELKQGRYDDALRTIQEKQTLVKQKAVTIWTLCVWLVEHNRQQDALELIRQCLEDTQTAWLYCMKGAIHLALGKLPDAVQAFESSVTLSEKGEGFDALSCLLDYVKRNRDTLPWLGTQKERGNIRNLPFLAALDVALASAEIRKSIEVPFENRLRLPKDERDEVGQRINDLCGDLATAGVMEEYKQFAFISKYSHLLLGHKIKPKSVEGRLDRWKNR